MVVNRLVLEGVYLIMHLSYRMPRSFGVFCFWKSRAGCGKRDLAVNDARRFRIRLSWLARFAGQPLVPVTVPTA